MSLLDYWLSLASIAAYLSAVLSLLLYTLRWVVSGETKDMPFRLFVGWFIVALLTLHMVFQIYGL